MLYWLMWIVVAFGRLLDRLLFWSFLRQELREQTIFPSVFYQRCFNGLCPHRPLQWPDADKAREVVRKKVLRRLG
jgi:hypothetical protein